MRGLYAFRNLGNNASSAIVPVIKSMTGTPPLPDHLAHSAWRYIDSGPSTGSLNMAIDEALLSQFEPNASDPVLRTYGWAPPALSLGRFQRSEEVLDLDRCSNNAVPVVRRVTGGGTIYHADELTYSIVCSCGHIPATTSVKDSFRVLTGFLVDFYRSLGLNAVYAVDTASAAEHLSERTAFCFAGKETFDIVIDGKKIGGNAQRRLKNVIFQHGSIPIINRSQYGLQYMKDRSPAYAENNVSLIECGINEDITTLKRLFLDAFNRHMGVEARLDFLSSGEQYMSQVLLEKKYTFDRWNLQGEAE
jgi:lipoate-protein ligase A